MAENDDNKPTTLADLAALGIDIIILDHNDPSLTAKLHKTMAKALGEDAEYSADWLEDKDGTYR